MVFANISSSFIRNTFTEHLLCAALLKGLRTCYQSDTRTYGVCQCREGDRLYIEVQLQGLQSGEWRVWGVMCE